MLGSKRDGAVKSSIYWRGPAEQAYYREMQRRKERPKLRGKGLFPKREGVTVPSPEKK